MQGESYFCTKYVRCKNLFYFAYAYRKLVSLFIMSVSTENVTEYPADVGFLCNKRTIIEWRWWFRDVKKLFHRLSCLGML